MEDEQVDVAITPDLIQAKVVADEENADG